MRAYRFALDPTSRQIRALESHCGAARFAFNHMLEFVIAVRDQRAAERSYDIPEDELTPAQGWSLPALRKVWNQRKEIHAPWWRENSKEAYNSGIDALSRALESWWKSKCGSRAGAAIGFPNYKSKHRSPQSVRFTTGTIRVEGDRHHITLPVLGRIHTYESTRKLVHHLDSGTARVLSATVQFEGGRWLCSLHTIVEVQEQPTTTRRNGHPVVGVDLGIKNLLVAATPDGTEVLRVAAPKPLNAALRRLRILQRRAARRCGRWDPVNKSSCRPSRRWTRNHRQLTKAHARVRNIRRHELHRATSTLTSEHDVIVIEDLNVAGMFRNRKACLKGFNRSVGDAALGALRTQLSYKAERHHITLRIADRWFPSTQICSGCGARTKLPLKEREYRCGICGLVIDRDLNAAVNLARLGERQGR
ncbi:IS607 family element RNA-guided endonuclease TnpB [Nocardia sp. NPDC052001]|uniref:IS607 family element RNA-guided endonuclease TnpB n=1 Tax=Nocardia sp. NPDC052001 TaxID=3154853 RepID=UPI003434DDB6